MNQQTQIARQSRRIRIELQALNNILNESIVGLPDEDQRRIEILCNDVLRTMRIRSGRQANPALLDETTNTREPRMCTFVPTNTDNETLTTEVREFLVNNMNRDRNVSRSRMVVPEEDTDEFDMRFGMIVPEDDSDEFDAMYRDRKRGM